MKISVIIPTFQPDDYILKCFDSLREQSLNSSAFEIIIILNGSMEPYYSMINYYINQNFHNNKVKFLQIEEAGVSRARNYGMSMASGKYITFIDDDDFVSPSYLEEMLKIANEGFMPLSNLIAFDHKSWAPLPFYVSKSFKRNHGKKKPHILQVRSFFSLPACKLIEKEAVGDVKFNTRFKIGEDSLFMAAISNHGREYKLTSEKAIYYRRLRADSVTGKKRPRGERVRNSISLTLAYLKIFFKDPFNYNLLFFTSRILGSFKFAVLKD